MSESGLKGRTVVLGTIGVDCHIIGAWIIRLGLLKEGANVINLGALVSQEEFIGAAVETNADAIAISSLCGHAYLDCQGFRQKCIEAGLKDILLYIGGNLNVEVGQRWEEVKAQFEELGFNRAYSTETTPEMFIGDIERDMAHRG